MNKYVLRTFLNSLTVSLGNSATSQDSGTSEARRVPHFYHGISSMLPLIDTFFVEIHDLSGRSRSDIAIICSTLARSYCVWPNGDCSI